MRKFLFTIIILLTFNLSSQEFQGQAFYKTQTAMDFGSWGDRMSAEQKKNMKERMKPFLEPVYILTFDKTKSIYKQEERLDAPGSGGGRGWGRMMASNGGPVYKDVVSKKSIQSTEFMGKKFLISNDQNNIKWEMQKEQKMIGSYLCFKATAQVQKPKTMTSVWRNSEKEAQKSKEQKDSIKINGKISIINADLHLLNYIKTLKIPLKKVAIELNKEIIDKNTLDKIKLKNNDKIEIVHFIGGG